MSVVPQGKSVQTMYRDFREGNLLVNRKYQRKLVWSLEEKQRLIDSILRGYPIPLILLAERRDLHGPGMYEIIDGIQRLNAIFSFIENNFDYDGHFFDTREFTTANQYAKKGAFAANANGPFLLPARCADILDYQLAVTIYPARDETRITEVFGRINASGRQLSSQEQRQAGVTSQFANLVRTLASELRGDASKDILLLFEMPEISIESGRETHGYGIRAEDTFWCRQGILSVKQLKESEDEQMMADIAASIVLDQFIPASKELLDKLYDDSTAESADLEKKLVAYGDNRLAQEIKSNFSVIRQVVEEYSVEPNFLRTTVRPGSGGQYPIKAPFYAIFMAFFDLVVRQQKSPVDSRGIMAALHRLSSKLLTGAHYETTDNRVHNVNLTKGLIQDHFVARTPPVFGHGPSLVIDFENALRRSKIESARYEFKQGILRLDARRSIDSHLLERLLETSCGIANIGPDFEGYIFIGVADKLADAEKIADLDGVKPREIGVHYVVGIDREAQVLGLSLDEYVQKVVAAFHSADLSEPLKTQILSGFDTITVHGLSVLRILIPPQKQLSFLGRRAFCRNGPKTVEITGKELVSVAKLFPA